MGGTHVEVAAALIGAGAVVNAKDATEQSTYLIATSEVGEGTALLDLTLETGADVNAKDSYNGTGLIRAAHAVGLVVTVTSCTGLGMLLGPIGEGSSEAL